MRQALCPRTVRPPSPFTWVQISAFGDDSSSDGGDVWSVEWDTKAKHWKQDAKVGTHTSVSPALLARGASCCCCCKLWCACPHLLVHNVHGD